MLIIPKWRLIFSALALFIGATAAHSSQPILKVNTNLNTVGKSVQLKSAQMPIKPIRTLNKAQLIRLKPIKPSEKKPQGPNPESYIALRDILDDPLLIKDIEKIAGWDSNMLFQDKAVGNLFYYVPRIFLLKHGANGYAFGVQYNKQIEQGQPSVTLSMELSAQGSPGEMALLKQILHEALELNSNEKIKLKSLSGSGVSVEFDSLATGLAIDKDRVHITPPKNLHDSFHITFSLTQDETESIFSLIAHEGMVGSLQLPLGQKKDEGSMGQVSIPFKIKYSSFSGEAIAGFQPWWLEKQPIKDLSNTSSFPITISGINGYVVEKGKIQRVVKPFKKETLLQPGKTKKIKLPSAEQVLGKDLLVAWLDFSLDSSCNKCIRNIKSQIDRGVADNPTTDITFEAIPSVFEDMELYKIIIRVKSPYYSVDRNKVEERAIQLTEEKNSSTLAIYYPEKKQNPLLFRYQIKVVTQAGEEITHNDWIDGRELTRIIGSSQLEAIIEQGQE